MDVKKFVNNFSKDGIIASDSRELTRRLCLLINHFQKVYIICKPTHRVRRVGNGDWEVLDDGGSLRPCKVTNPKHIKFFEKMFQIGDDDYSILS